MNIHPVSFFEEGKYKINPKLCFIIMPFGERWSDRIYKHIKEIVEEHEFVCKRADEFYGRVVLTDIWKAINEAAFIIADLTALNPNVYYELGIAHTLGKELIPIAQDETKIPFDAQPFRILFYQDNTDGIDLLKERLPKWIEDLTYSTSPILMLMKQDVDSFNDWRMGHKHIRFANEDLTNLVLKNINFNEVYFNESYFNNAKITYSSFVSSVMIRVDLSNGTFNNSNFEGANLSESDLSNGDFSDCNFINAILLRVRLDNAIFDNVDVEGVTIDYSTFQKYKGVFSRCKNKDKIIIESD